MSAEKDSVKVLGQLLEKLLVATPEEQGQAAQNLSSLANTESLEHDIPVSLYEGMKKAINDKKNTQAAVNALEGFTVMAASNELAPSVEPELVNMAGLVLEKCGDKNTEVKNAATAAIKTLSKNVTPRAIKAYLPHLTNSISNSSKWTEKVAALEAVDLLVDTTYSQIALRMPELVPVLSESMWDTKREVKTVATNTMKKATEVIENKDIKPFIPLLIEAVSSGGDVGEVVEKLGSTTFVSEVTTSSLSLMVPVLARGLAERDTIKKRKSAVIIDNMCKLVDDPQVIAPFMGELFPALKKNHAEIADPEARDVTQRAINTLKRVGNIGADEKIPEATTAGDVEVNLNIIKDLLKSKKVGPQFDNVIHYCASIAGDLIDERLTEDKEWVESIRPFLVVLLHDKEAQETIEQLRATSVANIPANPNFEDEDDDGEDLCNCEFSLAYGAKILLNRTQMRLKRGRRYGLCGPNGAGKSTLMRAIANGQVEGFPSQEECKTVYVEHDIDGTHADTNVVEYVQATAGSIVGTDEDVRKALLDFSFTEKMIDAPITALSGGWKMKLALATAVMRKADILLLDEPTNHLDVVNVEWLVNYLKTCGITSIIVSHDSGFLDNICQYIIHYENYKLRKYKGNLSEFVRRVPAAKSYYELGASEVDFQFPEPGFLEGVKTKQKAIVKVSNMTFQYPGTDAPQIKDINFQCSLSSRIAVIGPNGAGKSTLINVLTGELLPTEGDIYVHENMRIAYIKQHAFAHIDSHLDKTPSEYIQWRFQTGEDRETMDRANRVINEDDELNMNKVYNIEGTKRRVNEVLARRKFKNSYEYEVSFFLGENIGNPKLERWVPMMSSENGWIPRSELMESHPKQVAEVDMKEALASGQFRPLTRKEIEMHCAMLGLDAELVTHSRIRGLSGGQKVKLVLAACTWQRPHLIVLDEPTNYLDRDSLGALSTALKKFEGGVVLITHSAEFTKDLTEEVWAVNNGIMTPSGHNWVSGQGSGPRLDKKEEEGDQYDALGNKIEKKEKKKKLTASEARKKKKERMAKKKAGIEDLSDDDF